VDVGSLVSVGCGTGVNVGRGVFVGSGMGVEVGLGVLVGPAVAVGVLVGRRVLVGPAVAVGVLVGRRVLVGCAVSVLVGRSVLVGSGVSVVVGLAVLVEGIRVEVGRGDAIRIELISGLWQFGSARSIQPSLSSSRALKQFSPAPVMGISNSRGIFQTRNESKRICALELSTLSTNRPASPLAYSASLTESMYRPLI
jgi:hypothetical protein